MNIFRRKAKALKKLPARACNTVKARYAKPALGQSLDSLQRWFDGPLGKALIASQRDIVGDMLGNLFGYHLMQISVASNPGFDSASRVNHCFRISASASLSEAVLRPDNCLAVSKLEELPFADESIDICILHHALEFSENPQQVLKEAARVTISNGYVIIIGFNPNSLLGLLKPLAQMIHPHSIWRRHTLRLHRLKDWLEFLDFSDVSTRYSSHNLPINSHSYQNSTRLFDGLIPNGIPSASSYCLLARKDKVSMTPIKPEWSRSMFSPGVALPRRAVSAKARPSSTVVSFRKNIK